MGSYNLRSMEKRRADRWLKGLRVRAVVCTRYGPPEVLRLEELAAPTPRKNEVLIRILATDVTSSDCYVRGLRLTPAYRIMARLVLGWKAPRRPVLGMVLLGEWTRSDRTSGPSRWVTGYSASIDTASGHTRSMCAGRRTDFWRRDLST